MKNAVNWQLMLLLVSSILLWSACGKEDNASIIPSETNITFEAYANWEDPEAKTITITNGETGPLENLYAISSEPWLEVSIYQNTTGEYQLKVQPRVGGLAAEQYTAVITLSAQNTNEANTIIDVNFGLTRGKGIVDYRVIYSGSNKTSYGKFCISREFGMNRCSYASSVPGDGSLDEGGQIELYQGFHTISLGAAYNCSMTPESHRFEIKPDQVTYITFRIDCR